MGLLVIFISSLEKCLFSSLSHFWIRSFIFLKLSAESACVFLRLIICQLLRLLLFSPPLSRSKDFTAAWYFPEFPLGMKHCPSELREYCLSGGCQSTLLEAGSGARPILLLSSLTPGVLFPFSKSSVSHLETLRQGLNGRTGDWLRKWDSPCRNKQKQGACQAGERRGAGPEILQSLELGETIW